jgi:hypothetical protein
VDVLEEAIRGGYLKFLENYAILTLEEGEIEESEIVDSLKRLFDSNWNWQLRELEEYNFFVRFPPTKRILDILVGVFCTGK